ncbi:MAG: hypothetical protein M1840_005097 [Geoglossum simile]|nr:MAG: hypothetical protein M1840_005097 [Geoglossum simile]
MSRRSHGTLVYSEWLKFQETLSRTHQVSLNGETLDVPSVVATARYGAVASIDEHPYLINRIEKSVKLLAEELEQGHSVYGVTTGFGGNADTRTVSSGDLQVALLQMQLSAVLPPDEAHHGDGEDTIYSRTLPNTDFMASLSMPEAWVRGAMLVRINSLIRGHSAVRLCVVENIAKLLQNDCIPQVPLRGSISASGDLCPLSYIAGILEGNPDVHVWTGDRRSRKLIRADEVLDKLGMRPVLFGPGECLGVLNGTAVSAAVAALALHEANQLAVLSQVLTATAVEALYGRIESFNPFIAKVRPHPGQIEVARNVTSFLKGSLLARQGDACPAGQLRQDRYALRTSSQWIGPYLEDLISAHQQLSQELNSTTDNPLIDTSSRTIHHGGNFQAVAVTTSTEKTRLALQMIGKLLFAQSSELLNSCLNNGLPPNLSADNPSTSFTLKGVDINIAAYMAELAFLASPVSSHVQAAELNNQSVNSLALVSARYTHMSIDVLSLMVSAYVYSLCQALDLRVMDLQFREKLKPVIESITTEIFGPSLSPPELAALQESLWQGISQALKSTTNKDPSDRFTCVATQANYPIVQVFNSSAKPNAVSLSLAHLAIWTSRVSKASYTTFTTNRSSYLAHPDAAPYLGRASKRLYKFVRENLRVPINRGLCDHPTNKLDGVQQGKNTGSHISTIYKSLRTGSLMIPVMESLGEALANGSGAKL